MAVSTDLENTMEDEILQILASSVFLRSNDTPLDVMATALSLSKYDQAAASDDNGNTFQNVHYYSDSEPSTPTFINCRLENVDFVQCNFANTEFRNLTLTNVAIFYVHCDNVTVSDLSLEDCLWHLAVVRNAMLVHNSTEKIGNTKFITLQPQSHVTSCHFEDNTLLATRRLSSISIETAMDVRRYKEGFQAFVRTVQSPQCGTLLSRLMDHKHIVPQIVDYIIGEDDESFKRYVDVVNRSQDHRTYPE